MLVGKPAPDIDFDAYVKGQDGPQKLSLKELQGKWVVLFFYPRDFTFVCPTEIQSFASLAKDFEKEKAVILGASTDSYWSHKNWYETDERLADVAFPVIADSNHKVAEAFEVLQASGAAFRGTFIIDPDGVVQHVSVNTGEAGRNIDETLRTLQAFRTGGRCPAGWTPGQATI